METEPKSQSTVNLPAPAIGIRVACWFGIYLAAQVPLIYRPDFRFSLELMLMFPFFLGSITAPICNLFQYGTPLASIAFILGFYIFPYSVYAANLYGLSRAHNRRRSSFLLLLLVLIVLFNQFLFGGMVHSIYM